MACMRTGVLIVCTAGVGEWGGVGVVLVRADIFVKQSYLAIAGL
jgi:hypothetical protein